MLPSLPILAGQGFIIRAAQKSTASRVAKDRKAFVLNVSTWVLFPRQILCDAHTLLIIRILKAPWRPQVPLAHQAPDFSPGRFCFQDSLDVSHCEFLKEREQLLRSIL